MPTARGDRSTRDFKRRGDQTVRSRGPRSKRWGFVELGIAVGDRAPARHAGWGRSRL